jgi:hypothetical protein
MNATPSCAYDAGRNVRAIRYTAGARTARGAPATAARKIIWKIV